LNSTASTVIAGRDTIVFHVTGFPGGAIDVMGTLNGRPIPPQRHWTLNSSQEIRMKVGESTLKGLYHFIGIRNSYDPDPNQWIKIDRYIQIR
jgi:hypothetical protein